MSFLCPPASKPVCSADFCSSGRNRVQPRGDVRRCGRTSHSEKPSPKEMTFSQPSCETEQEATDQSGLMGSMWPLSAAICCQCVCLIHGLSDDPVQPCSIFSTGHQVAPPVSTKHISCFSRFLSPLFLFLSPSFLLLPEHPLLHLPKLLRKSH